MSVTLSDGTVLNETGKTDNRGYPIYINEQGDVYTNQNGKMILSSPSRSGDTGNSYTDYLNGIYSNTAQNTNTDAAQASDYKSEAEDLVEPYTSKSLDLLNKSIALARKQAEEVKKQEEEQQVKEEKSTYATEDRTFADALDAAQQGFAGRGTFTSGFRQGANEKQDVERAANLDELQQDFANKTDTRNLSYSQYLETSALEEEQKKLDLEREKENMITTAQDKLRGIANTKSESQSDTATSNFKRFLGSGGTA